MISISKRRNLYTKSDSSFEQMEQMGTTDCAKTLFSIRHIGSFLRKTEQDTAHIKTMTK